MEEPQQLRAAARLSAVWRNFKSRTEQPDLPDEMPAMYVELKTSDENSEKGPEGAPFVPYSFRLMAAWSWRFVIVIAAIVLVLYGLSFVTIVVIPLLVALLLSALLAPATNAMTRHGVRRGLATSIAFFGMIIVVAALLALVGQQIASGVSDLTAQVQSGINTVIDWLYTGPFGIDPRQFPEIVKQVTDELLNALKNNSGSVLGGALSATTSAGHFAAGLIIALFATFFFLLDGKNIFFWVTGMLPKRAHARARAAALRGWMTLVQYVRVQVIVAFTDAAGVTIGAAILGVPLVVPLGVLVFLGSFIPIVGAVLTGAVAVLVALVAKGWVTALIMLGVVLLVQQLESHFLQPFIMGKAVSVHPLAVILAVATGSFLAGIPGALFAVPLVAVANSVVLDLSGRGPGGTIRVAPDPAAVDDPPPDPVGPAPVTDAPPEEPPVPPATPDGAA